MKKKRSIVFKLWGPGVSTMKYQSYKTKISENQSSNNLIVFFFIQEF